MYKKKLCWVLALIMLFSFAGCKEKIDLDQYKKDAKKDLFTFSNVLIYDLGGRYTYDFINGLGIYNMLNAENAEIDGATNKQGVDDALRKAKNRFTAIPIWFETQIIDVRWKDACHTFGLKYFDFNAVFECSTNVGLFKVIGVGAELSEFSISHEDNHASWSQGDWDRVYWYPGDDFTNRAFMDLVVRIDNQIVSYAVIEMILVEETIYCSTLLGCAIPEKVGDEYKTFDEDGVQVSIAKLKE